MLMSLPDVCQLFKRYDVQLYKKIENILLQDFLEDVSIQYLRSVQLFSKKFKLWLLNSLSGFPPLLQFSKLKEVTVFVKRLRRKTYLSNIAKTMKMVLENKRRFGTLKSDLHAIISQGTLDISKTSLASTQSSMEEVEDDTEIKCLSNLISLLGTTADLSIFLNCLSTSLQAIVFQPSRSKEEFIKLAASFQLRWNFLLTAVSKAMTLCHRESFGSWYLFHLLLLEYAIHILQSYMEKEDIEEEKDMVQLRDIVPEAQPLVQPDQALYHLPDSSPTPKFEDLSLGLRQVTLKYMSQSRCPMEENSMVLRILGFLTDMATGNKLIQVLL